MQAVNSRRERFYAPWFLLFSLWLIWVPHAIAEEWIYTARPGDTLWAISKTYLKDVSYWGRLQRHNAISQTKLIPPGTRLRIPYEWLKYQPAPARVQQVAGAVTVISPNSGSTPATVDMQLFAGAEIHTGAGATTMLRFADDSSLLVLENSVVTLDTLSAFGETGMVDTRMRLQRGRIDIRVTPFKVPDSRFEVITPAAVAAVRGTDFRVSAERDTPVMRSEVLGGTVAVAAGGMKLDVPAGFGTRAEAGKPPLKPRALLPAPNLVALPTQLRGSSVQLTWPAVHGAVAYRIQLAADMKFDSLLRDTLVRSPNIAWPDLPMGGLVLRVRAIDGVGLEGLNAHHSLVLEPPLSPPVSNVLPGHRVAMGAEPVFEWHAVQDAAMYRFQMASTPDFASPLLDVVGAQLRYVPALALAPGDYYWRLSSQDGHGNASDFSEARMLTVASLPAAPTVNLPDVTPTQVKLQWSAVSGATGYQIQIARDTEFTDLLLMQDVGGTALEILRPAAGHYYARAKSTNEMGLSGAYGTIQTLNVPSVPSWPLLLLLLPFLL